MKRPLQILTLFFPVAILSCAQSQDNPVDYAAQVGDIVFESDVDDPNFQACDEERVFQYYNFGNGVQYKGEKPKIEEHFFNGLKVKGDTRADNGFLTIRFVVNCRGETGRFRMQGMDNDYNAKEFSPALSNALLSLTKELDGWIVPEHEGVSYDYYQYLTFKIENGALIEIMP